MEAQFYDAPDADSLGFEDWLYANAAKVQKFADEGRTLAMWMAEFARDYPDAVNVPLEMIEEAEGEYYTKLYRLDERQFEGSKELVTR